MTVEVSGSLSEPKNARLMHVGVSAPFTVNDANTTAVDSSTFGKNNPINGLTSDRYKPDATSWTIELDITGGTTDITGLCIGSDDLFTNGQTVTIQRDNSGFVDIDSVTPTNDSPVMFLFDSVASGAKVRINGTGSGKPSIYNIMVGNPLKMQRSFYGGYSPARLNRKTEVIGNVSGSGELLGRSKRRTILQGSYTWENLTKTWVDANLEGPSGAIISLEDKQAYIAWRPDDEGDCDYIMRAQSQAPQAQGIKNLWSYSFSAEVHSYE